MNFIQIKPISSPLSAAVSIPGSKSYTNRAMILAALSDKLVTIHNPLKSDDTLAMVSCLRSMGFAVDETSDSFIVDKRISNDLQKLIELNARLSGTTIRFILALACVIPGTKLLAGMEGLNKRPIKDLVEGLRQLGAQIEYTGIDGFPPLKITSSDLKPGAAKLNGDISSQYFTALMMIAPKIGDVSIEVIGNQISKSYIDMTIDTMKQFGVGVVNDHYQRYTIAGGQTYNLDEYTVEGDFSGAGYFFAIAALTKSTITLNNLNPSSKQGDRQFVEILKKMGNKVSSTDNSMTIAGNGVQPINIDMELCPDQAQTLAVLAAFAPGKTVMTGIRSLRVKETERVIAVQNELKKMGIRTEATNDSLTVYGGNPKPATIDTYGDHRMAMAFAVAGTKLPGMKINNPSVVDKTFPDFWKKLQNIGIGISYE